MSDPNLHAALGPAAPIALHHVTSPSARIPSLDGLRAVAIVMVLISHASHTLPQNPWAQRFAFTFGNPALGVSLFFVVSGYLITRLLLLELDATGTISLKDFFFRRAFRILPAYWCYLAFCICLWAFGVRPWRPLELAAAVAFVTDYAHVQDWLLGHTWSLSVEEQFYVLWPFTLRGAGRVRATRIAIAIMVLTPLLRAFVFVVHPDGRATIEFTGHLRADCLMFGCLAALLENSARFRSMCEWAQASKVHYLGGIFIVLWLPRIKNLYSNPFTYALSDSIVAAILTLWVLALIRNPASVAGRAMNAPAIVFVGTISYSLYLWQQPFFTPTPLGVVSTFPLNALVIAAAAAVSYFLIERPALGLRRRIQSHAVMQIAPAG